MSAAKEEKILDRVRALLAIADHPNTPPAEADTALNMANSLMSRHAIDEALARAAQSKSSRRAPTKRAIKLARDTQGGSSLWSSLRTILHYIAETNRCKMVHVRWSDDPMIYGMTEDVEWVEMLYTQVYFSLVSKINPRWDESKGYDENVYNFKVAGFKWAKIDEVSRQHGGPDARVWEESRGQVRRDEETGEWIPRYNYFGRSDEHRNVQVLSEENEVGAYGSYEIPVEGKIRGTMITAYRRHAKKIGDTNPVATQSFQAYRDSFVEAFQSRLVIRLRDQAASNSQDAATHGAEVALRDSMEDILKAMFEDHPELSPEAREARDRAIREQAAREAAEEARRVAAMTPRQRAEYYDKREREARRQARANAKYWDEQDRKMDRSAHARGRSAADSVQLSRVAPVKDMSKTSQIGE